MKNATECAKKLTALLKKLPSEPALPADVQEPIDVFVHAFLLADAAASKAETAFRRLRNHVVDYNDLRVSMPHETVAVIGARYPKAVERCTRLREALRQVYLREHAVTLAGLAEAGKRDVRKYLESIEGISSFVSSRIMLLCFDVHAIPVDEQLRGRLADEGVVDPDASIADVAAWLTRQVKANDGQAVHGALHAWAEKGTGRRKAAAKTTKTPARKAAAKGTAKKSTAQKTGQKTAKKTSKKKTTTKKSGRAARSSA